MEGNDKLKVDEVSTNTSSIIYRTADQLLVVGGGSDSLVDGVYTNGDGVKNAQG